MGLNFNSLVNEQNLIGIFLEPALFNSTKIQQTKKVCVFQYKFNWLFLFQIYLYLP